MQKNNKFSKRKGTAYLLFALLIPLFFAVTYYINQGVKLHTTRMNKSIDEEELNRLWENKEYKKIAEVCDEVLEENYLDVNFLAVAGFANFYMGISQVSLEMKIPFINQSIFHLRKALIAADDELRGKISYVLGKAYYYKGRHYSDLCIKYLDMSLEEGYSGTDIYEFKGLAYYDLKEYQFSLDEFMKLSEEKRSADVLFIMASAYGQLDRHEDKEIYLKKVLSKADKLQLKIDTNYMLASSLLKRGRYSESLEYSSKVIKLKPDYADGLILYGKIQTHLGNGNEAIKAFKKTLILRPGDKEALAWLKER